MFEQWKNEYNKERPHKVLDMKTPDGVCIKSEREYNGESREF